MNRMVETNWILIFSAKPTRYAQKKREADESIRSNLRQYGLEKYYMDVLIADASRAKMWREQTLFDAIITDREYLKLYVSWLKRICLEPTGKCRLLFLIQAQRSF